MILEACSFVSLAATSWPDVAMGAITALVPLLWGVIELRKRKLALLEAQAAKDALDTEKKAHKATRMAFKAQTSRLGRDPCDD